jgi:large subunit ribosomal protein L17
MRHKKKTITLGRTKAPREALLRNLAESLILHNSIKTTKAKARALRTIVEPLVTKAKKNTLASQRNIRKTLYTDEAVKKLIKEIAPRYAERAGGYTRITKIGTRKNDAAEVVIIEFV